MTKRLFQVLFFAATLFATAQVSAQSFPSVAPPPGTTTYNSLPALPPDFLDEDGGNVFITYQYAPNGTINMYSDGVFLINKGVGDLIFSTSPITVVAAAPTLPSGYSYTPTGQILTPSGTTVSSFDFNNATVPFDGGMSLVLLASGIGYASKRMKAKKAIAK